MVRTKLQIGTDLNGTTNDGTVEINFGQPWQLNPAAPVASNEFDFVSTVYHELLHAVGFFASPAQNGDPVFGTTGAGEWGAFDQFIGDPNDTNIISSAGALNQTLYDTEKVGGASPFGGLFFSGPNADAANGGNPVGLFTPTTFQDGSSVSHLDDDNPALAGLTMLAATDTGPSARTFSPIEIGILLDPGYTPIPLPPALLLLVSAFPFLGLRRLMRH